MQSDETMAVLSTTQF